MKKTDLFLTGMAGFAVLFGTLGCGKSEREEPVEAVVSEAEVAEVMEPDIPIDESPLYDLYQKVDGLLTGGDTNQANAVFVAALDDPEMEPVKAPLFSTLIRYFIFTDQLEDAKKHYLNALRTMPEIAEPGFDTIYGAYVGRGDHEGALAWARVLATQDIGDDLRMTATDWLIGSLLRNGQFEEMVAAAADAIETFDPAQFAPRLARVGQEALASGKISVAEDLVACVQASSQAEAAPYVELAQTIQIRIDAEMGKWDALIARIPQLLSAVADQPLMQAMRHAFQAARREGQFDKVEEMASAIVHADLTAERDRTRFLAAREWVGLLFAVEEPDLPSFPVRMNKLMAVGLEPRQLYSLYSRHFYDVINDAEVVKACIPFVDALIPLMTEESSQNALRSYQLDACFLADDYDRALEILEKGLPERDADWHAMAITKVKAHKAQADGRFEAAVGYYRQFMETIKDEDIPDPATAVVYSQATLMGNNEKRIGDIYTGAGKPEEAALAYAAAREWYDQALEANQAGEATETYIRAQMEAVPGETATDDTAAESNPGAGADVDPAPESAD